MIDLAIADQKIRNNHIPTLNEKHADHSANTTRAHDKPRSDNRIPHQFLKIRREQRHRRKIRYTHDEDEQHPEREEIAVKE